MKKMLFITLAGFFLLALPALAQFNLLHEFAAAAGDGRKPYGSLVLSGSTLYGMTHFGSISDDLGVIFKIQADGNGFALLHEFDGTADDGSLPYGSLVLSGSTLYGMTERGGAYGYGTVFKIETNGDGFAVLHSFAAGTADGAEPSGSLVVSGTTLYGMTPYYGAHTKGTIFKINTDGGGFALLHSFAGGAADGAFPFGSLALSGSTLYGMTYNGGGSDTGTVFAIGTNGLGFTLLHTFAGGTGDGKNPYGSLTLSGSTLYGMTYYGGSGDFGTVFKVGTSGAGFSLLRSFTGDPGTGVYPYGSLILSGSTLYGMTLYGWTIYGGGSHGSVFSLQTDGGGFATLHTFVGGLDDGASPYGDLTLDGSLLYGMTMVGGDNNQGVLFSLSLPSSITVVSPNGGEHWTIGSAKNITWTASNYTGTLRLVLFKGGVRFGNIATGVSASAGSYAWTVGQTVDGGTAPTGTDYRFYLRSTDNTLVDPSDYRFSLINPAQLQVTSPNGGESWALGSQHAITWNANGYAGTVRLILFQNAKKIGQIAGNVPALQGTYNWTVGSYSGGTTPAGILYSIRIQASDGSQEDFSDGPLTITE